MWLFSIGNGAKIQPLEKGRKSPESAHVNARSRDGALVTDSTHPLFSRLYVQLVNEIVHLVRNGNL